MTTETKPDCNAQTTAEAIVAEALARHGHVVPEPNRHLRPQLVTAPTMVRRVLLGSTPLANVQSDGKGGYLDGPPPAQPVAPDYQQSGPT